MSRWGALLMFCVGSAALGAALAVTWQRQVQGRPGPPSALVVEQMREVARLQTLEVTLHKKVAFSPAPVPADSVWHDVLHWAAQALRPAHGKVIVFALARLGLDLGRLGPDSLRVEGRTVFVVLPPMQVDIELLPGETEVIGSNLDSGQTAELLEAARQAFQKEVAQDPRLRLRARTAAERALSGLLVSLGFEQVLFVDTLPATVAPPAG